MKLGTGEIILIVLVVLMLFGARRIPEIFRALGSGVKEFKAGMRDDPPAPHDQAAKPTQGETPDKK